MQHSSPLPGSIPALWQQHRPDIRLLLFLVLLVNVKLALKGIAIASVLLLVPELRRSISLKKASPFYSLLIAIALANWIINKGFEQWITTAPFLIATLTWTACLLAAGAMRFFAGILTPEALERTLVAFFLLNAGVVLLQYAAIVLETGALNPYRYQGDHQKYFIGTGDYLKGISFDTSVANAAINTLGLVYFLRRQRTGMALLCMGALLLAGSNLITAAGLGLLLFLVAWRPDRLRQSTIVVCLFFALVFFAKVSPQNSDYITRMAAYSSGRTISEEKTETPQPTREELRKKAAKAYIDSLHAAQPGPARNQAPIAALSLPRDDIHSAAFQDLDDTIGQRKNLISYVQATREEEDLQARFGNSRLPGKWLALQQSIRYLEKHPQRLAAGLGAGNYSSRLAFRTTALSIAGSYPMNWKYLHPAFETDHFPLYLYYFSQRDARHSVLHAPDSVYDQLLMEYGIMGLLALCIFFFGYFFRRMKDRPLGIPVLLFLAFLFATGYWLEQLSLVPVAELLLFASWKKAEGEA
jgi:hypothetical protein